MSADLIITDAVEHAFCPKFTYFQKVLGISEHQERRGTLLKGRQVHSSKASTNVAYIPTTLPKGEKIVERLFYSKQFAFVGKIDQAVITTNEVILIELKYRKPFIGKTLLTQIGLQSVLVEENIGKPCTNALLEFLQGGRQTIHLKITPSIKEKALQELSDTRQTIVRGEIPYSEYNHRCDDCAYRRICPVGILKRSQ